MNNIYNIWFSTVRLSNRTKFNLLENNSAEDIWKMDKEALEKIILDININKNTEEVEKQINEILDEEKRKLLEKYYEYMCCHDMKLICYNDIEYPSILKNIKDFPIFIYVRGNLENLYKDNIAIVGSRYASTYGKKVAMELANYVCDRNVGVVSGMAIRNRQICTSRKFEK